MWVVVFGVVASWLHINQRKGDMGISKEEMMKQIKILQRPVEKLDGRGYDKMVDVSAVDLLLDQIDTGEGKPGEVRMGANGMEIYLPEKGWVSASIPPPAEKPYEPFAKLDFQDRIAYEASVRRINAMAERYPRDIAALEKRAKELWAIHANDVNCWNRDIEVLALRTNKLEDEISGTEFPKEPNAVPLRRKGIREILTTIITNVAMLERSLEAEKKITMRLCESDTAIRLQLEELKTRATRIDVDGAHLDTVKAFCERLNKDKKKKGAKCPKKKKRKMKRKA